MAKVLLQPGATPLPGYTLRDRLGKGGYGEVWKAVKHNGFEVALKFIELEKHPLPQELRSLEVLRQIRHPNLLNTLNVQTVDQYLVVEMELADGTLLDRLHEATAQGLPGIPRPELLEYMREAAKGIDYLNAPRHQLEGKTGAAIQHLDIKPPNLLLVGGSTKVGDLGLMRVLDHTTTTHQAGISPHYAAPELFNKKATLWSDQYALAVSYCQLRAGRLPFNGTAWQLMHGHCLEPPDLSMLPPAEAAIVARGLAKNPHDRWTSCLEFVRALDATAEQPLPGAQPHGVGELTTMVTPPVPQAVPPPAPPVPVPEPPQEDETTKPNGRAEAALPAQQAVRCFQGHTSAVWQVAFLNDGRHVTSSSSDNTLRLWDRDTGLEARRFPVPRPPVVCTAFGSEGRQVLTSGMDRTIWLWDFETAREILNLKGHTAAVNCLVLAADGRTVLSGSWDQTIRLWSLMTADELRCFRGHTQGITSVALSADGQRLLSGSWDRTVRLWEMGTGRELQRCLGHTDLVNAVAFLPDGGTLVSASSDGTIRLWNAATGAERLLLAGHGSAVSCVACAPSGPLLASGGADRTLRVWRIATGEPVATFEGHTDLITSVAWSPDGRWLLSGSKDRSMRLWAAPG